MKTLVYKVVFRLNVEEADENVYNEGFVVCFFNESNEFVRMEGLLTNDYLIAEVVKDSLIITVYTSYIVDSIYSPEDLENIKLFSPNSLDIYWEGEISKYEIEFPFSFYFENKFVIGYEDDIDFDDYDDVYDDDLDIDEILDDDNLEYEYGVEKAELFVTEIISKKYHKQYIQLLSEFKLKHVFINEEWS